ncbi:hypothetical protein SDC9_194533 [bioreactor metagenome]|uniref:Uncharacterized protein n=1 Tax=bioreactor metagenome TaxID=1076179 RepID=A0A645IF51_9ZZZZ
MRRRRYARTASAGVLHYRYRERRALHGVGASAELVEKHHRLIVRRFQHLHYIDRVRRKRGQVLLYALLVADVGQNARKHGHSAAVSRGYVQSALRHQRQQTHGLERHCLSSGVRAGYEKRVEFYAELNVYRHRGIAVEQRMTGAAQHNSAVAPYLRP